MNRALAITKTKELVEGFACPEAKEAAKAYLAAVDTANEAKAQEALITELNEDIIPIDGLIAFIGSDAGKGVFGDQADAKMAEAKERKAQGEKYCNCPGCSKALEILAAFEN